MTPKEILDIKLGLNDANAETVGEFLKALLTMLWEQEESFSGKRPLGNSGWKAPIEFALVKAGVVTGTIISYDSDDGMEELTEIDQEAFDKAILSAIDALN